MITPGVPATKVIEAILARHTRTARLDPRDDSAMPSVCIDCGRLWECPDHADAGVVAARLADIEQHLEAIYNESKLDHAVWFVARRHAEAALALLVGADEAQR